MRETSARRPGPSSSTARSRRTARSFVGPVAVALLLAGCSQHATTSPAPEPTPLAKLDTSAMRIPRIEFCPLVPAAAVHRALGAKPGSSASYGNGDDVDLAGVGREVVHEIGCSWSTAAGATARAWLFARPVDAAFARQAIASSKDTRDCRVTAGPAYGDPSLTQTCHRPDGATRIRHAGLFGQTWLTCEVSDRTAAAMVRARADTWCAELATALDTTS